MIVFNILFFIVTDKCYYHVSPQFFTFYFRTLRGTLIKEKSFSMFVGCCDIQSMIFADGMPLEIN